MLKRGVDSIPPLDFFGSLQFGDPQYIFPIDTVRDTSLFYQVLSPVKFVGWKSAKKENEDQEDAGDKYGHDYQYRNYFIPHSDEKIFIVFERFGKYFYAPSYDSLWKKKLKYYTQVKSLHVRSERISNDSSEYYVELEDTNSSRIIAVKMLTSGDRLYKLSTTTDKRSGLSDFAETFYNSFRCADTTLGKAFYESKSDIWFDDLLGEDSLKTIYAIESISDIHFDIDQAVRAIEVFESFRHDEFELDERADLLENFGTLKHPMMLGYLKEVYNRSMDTASLQLAVLRALSKRPDKKSFSMLKELLFREVPLVSESSVKNLMGLWTSRPEVYAELYPKLLDLIRYGEYKAPVLTHLQHLLDSGNINPRSYKRYVDILLSEGKDNIKRIMLVTEKSSNNNRFIRSRYSSTPDYSAILTAINRILLPYSSRNDVVEYFQRTLRLNNNEHKIKSMVQLLSLDCHVPDTLWTHFASMPETREILYSELERIDRLDRFPAEFTEQRSIAEGLILSGRDLDDIDSFQFYKKVPAANKDRKGYLYLFKHWDEDDKQWRVDLMGIMPSDSNQLISQADIQRRNMPFHSEEEFDRTMEDLLEELLYDHRKRVKKPRRSYF